MSYIVQQSDLDVLNQKRKNLYARAELLNNDFQTVEEVDGEIIDYSYSIDANSDVRRTYNVSFVVSDSSFSLGRDKKIWFDKYIKLSIGIYYIRNKEILWYPLGLFIMDSLNYSFNESSRTLSLSCSDRVAELSGARYGQIAGIQTLIPAFSETPTGENVENQIRNAMVSVVTQLGGIKKYRIEDISESIPYDLEFGTGSTVWDIIKTLRDLYPGWETFFDHETFIYQPIPTYTTDPIVLTHESIAPLVISEQTSQDLSLIKNVTEIWGKCLDADYYSETSSMDTGGTYSINNPAISSLNNGMTVAFKVLSNSIDGASIKINSFTAKPIIIENNEPMPSDTLKKDKSYVFKYSSIGTGSFYYLGQWQIIAVTKLVSKYPDEQTIQYDLVNEPTDNISYIVRPDNPFCSNYPDIGEIRQVLSGGDYDNIYSEGLAKQRAEYDNWMTTDMLDSITLDMIDIPWLDVNQKIEYRSLVTGKIDIYLVQSIRGSSSGGRMTITAKKFQPQYPWL